MNEAAIKKDKEAIKKKLETDNEYLVGALAAIYSFQTDEEQIAKVTVKQNNMGFSSYDAEVLSDIYRFYEQRGFLTEKQMNLVRKRMVKYTRQLQVVTVEKKPLKGTQEKGKQENMGKPKRKRKKSPTAFDMDENRIKLLFDYDVNLIPKIKLIHGRRFVNDGKFWTVPKTVTNAHKVMDIGFKLDKSLQDWLDSHTAGVSSDIEIPGLKATLYPFQKECVSYIEIKGGNALVGDQMGLGKSLESLAYCQLHRGENPVVIVCPASLKHNWRREIEKFIPDPSVLILSGRYDESVKLDAEFIIINYDILSDRNEKVEQKNGKKKRVPIPGTGWISHLMKINPQILIIDEAHACKNKETLRTKAVSKLAKQTPKVIGLTGTPILNRPIEIFQPLQMINPKVFPSFKQFAWRYCNPTHNGFGWDFNGASNTVELNQILTSEVMIRRLKEDVLKDLPPITRAVIPLEISNRKQYNSARDDLIRFLMEIDEEKAKKASRAETLAKIETLKQLAVKGKMESALEWITDFLEQEKLVLFATHKSVVDELYEKFHKKYNAVRIYGGTSASQRDAAVQSFQNDENTRLFIGNIQAAGTGLTLTAASNVAFLEFPWTPGELFQAEARCHRISQASDSVNVWNLLGIDTIDEDMFDILNKKARVLDQVVDGADVHDSSVFDELISSYKK